MAARLREHYQKNVVPALVKEFGYKNIMAVPKVEKVSLNIGLGEATQNPKLMDGAVNELALVAGQRPVVTKEISAACRRNRSTGAATTRSASATS
jgi:large subunit ribosomal protein L5